LVPVVRRILVRGGAELAVVAQDLRWFSCGAEPLPLCAADLGVVGLPWRHKICGGGVLTRTERRDVWPILVTGGVELTVASQGRSPRRSGARRCYRSWRGKVRSRTDRSHTPPKGNHDRSSPRLHKIRVAGLAGLAGLAGWLAGWRAGWRAGGLAGGLAGWRVGWRVGGLAGGLAAWRARGAVQRPAWCCAANSWKADHGAAASQGSAADGEPGAGSLRKTRSRSGEQGCCDLGAVSRGAANRTPAHPRVS
jgi:hypothetical protein